MAKPSKRATQFAVSYDFPTGKNPFSDPRRIARSKSLNKLQSDVFKHANRSHFGTGRSEGFSIQFPTSGPYKTRSYKSAGYANRLDVHDATAMMRRKSSTVKFTKTHLKMAAKGNLWVGALPSLAWVNKKTIAVGSLKTVTSALFSAVRTKAASKRKPTRMTSSPNTAFRSKSAPKRKSASGGTIKVKAHTKRVGGKTVRVKATTRKKSR